MVTGSCAGANRRVGRGLTSAATHALPNETLEPTGHSGAHSLHSESRRPAAQRWALGHQSKGNQDDAQEEHQRRAEPYHYDV